MSWASSLRIGGERWWRVAAKASFASVADSKPVVVFAGQFKRHAETHALRWQHVAPISDELFIRLAHRANLMSTNGDTSQIKHEELNHVAGGGSARIKR